MVSALPDSVKLGKEGLPSGKVTRICAAFPNWTKAEIWRIIDLNVCTFRSREP
jgi:hypothetical protein